MISQFIASISATRPGCGVITLYLSLEELPAVAGLPTMYLVNVGGENEATRFNSAEHLQEMLVYHSQWDDDVLDLLGAEYSGLLNAESIHISTVKPVVVETTRMGLGVSKNGDIFDELTEAALRRKLMHNARQVAQMQKWYEDKKAAEIDAKAQELAKITAKVNSLMDRLANEYNRKHYYDKSGA